MSIIKLSRVAKINLTVPQDVSVEVTELSVNVRGKFGSSQINCHPAVVVSIVDSCLSVRPVDNSKIAKTMSGTLLVLIRNAVTGVSFKFTKKLTLVGVGYRAQVISSDLQLSVGFSQPVLFKLPSAIACDIVNQTEINLHSHDKMLLGLIAAKIRGIRPPEPYKGKGIRYANEKVSLKEVKKK